MNVFLSYRREDSAGYTGRLHDRLTQRWSQDSVFWDIDNIEPGEDFVEVIDRTLAQCTVTLVIIGPRWLEVTDADGQRRIDSPADFHRIEIERALHLGLRVIPVLVGNARMPSEARLPESLKAFARRNALELTDKRFNYDANKLADSIERGLRKPEAGPQAEVSSAPREVERKPAPPAEIVEVDHAVAAAEDERQQPRAARRGSFAPWLLGAGTFVAIALFIGWPAKAPRVELKAAPEAATTPLHPSPPSSISPTDVPRDRADAAAPAPPQGAVKGTQEPRDAASSKTMATPKVPTPSSAPSRAEEPDRSRPPVLAEKAPARAKVASAPSKERNRNPLCSDVLNRLQLGEPISSDEQALFNKECGR